MFGLQSGLLSIGGKIRIFLIALQLPTSNRTVLSHGYSTAKTAGLRGAAFLVALQLAHQQPR
jgi:hypothetical protein